MIKEKNLKKRIGNTSLEIVISLCIFIILSTVIIRLFTGLYNVERNMFLKEWGKNTFSTVNEVLYSCDSIEDVQNSEIFQGYKLTQHKDMYFFVKGYTIRDINFEHSINLKVKDSTTYKNYLNLKTVGFDSEKSKKIVDINNNLYIAENEILLNNQSFYKMETLVTFLNVNNIEVSESKKVIEDALNER